VFYRRAFALKAENGVTHKEAHRDAGLHIGCAAVLQVNVQARLDFSAGTDRVFTCCAVNKEKTFGLRLADNLAIEFDVWLDYRPETA